MDALLAGLFGYITGLSFFALIFIPLILIAFFIYFSICLQKIGEKLNHPYPWVGWIRDMFGYPSVALIQYSESPWWWYFLLWIPLVGTILTIIMYAKIYERLGRPSWWCIFLLIPVVHLILLGLASFTDSECAPRHSSNYDDFDDSHAPHYTPPARHEEPRTAYQGASNRAYGVLVVIDGVNKGQSFRLTPGSTNVIGRAGNVQLPIDDRTASREHARIRDENGKFVLYDLGSTNKTYVNNQFSDRKVLMDGDVIKTGRTKFRFGWIRNK